MTPRRALLVALGAALLATGADAHDYRVGEIVIDHPYATPSPTGRAECRVYLRSLRNRGAQGDRLIGASSPAAQVTQILCPAGADAPAKPLAALDLPGGAHMRLRHGGADCHLWLAMKAPVGEGDRFPLTFQFEHAGTKEVNVWVVRPREPASGPADNE